MFLNSLTHRERLTTEVTDMIRIVRKSALAALLLLSCNALVAETLKVAGYPEVLQQHDMNELDASINFGKAMAALLKDEAVEASLEMYESRAGVIQDFAAGRLQGAFLTTPDFMEIQKHANPAALYTLSWDGQPTLKYVLLSNDRRVRSVRKLKNKRLTMSVGMQIGSLILFDELASIDLPEDGRLFKSATRVRNSETALVDLMFRKTDVALVPSLAFELAQQENPQVGKQLHKVFESKGYVPGVFAIHSSVSKDMVLRLEAKLTRMHELPEGQHVLDLFHAKRMVRVDNADLASVADLIAAR